MNDILGAIAGATFLLFVIIMFMVGLYVSVIGDVRNFDVITKLCNEQGYIQSEKIRIYCQVENENNIKPR